MSRVVDQRPRRSLKDPESFKSILEHVINQRSHFPGVCLLTRPHAPASDSVRLVLTTTGQRKAANQHENVRELPTIRKELTVDMSRAIAERSPYFASQLQERASAEGEDVCALRLAFNRTSAATAEGVLACLESVASTSLEGSALEIDYHNQFQVLAAAANLKLGSVIEKSIDFVIQNLSTATVVAATKFAVHLESAKLLQACYYFVKSHLIVHGCGPPATNLKVDMMGGKRKKKSAQKLAAKVSLMVTEDQMLRYGNSSVSIKVFRDLGRADFQAKLIRNVANFVYDLYYVDEINLSETSAFPRVYKMHHDHNDEFIMMAYQEDEFGEFIISTSQEYRPRMTMRYDPEYMGCVTSNFLGTSFHVYDSGVDAQKLVLHSLRRVHAEPGDTHHTPEDEGHDPLNDASLPTLAANALSAQGPNDGVFPTRRELASVEFDRNVMGSAPRALRVRVPSRKQLEASPQPAVPPSQEEETVDVNLGPRPAGGVEDDLDLTHHIELNNKPPFWSEENECWMLDFFGRVNLASAKNFQLIQGEGGQEVFLMFGKLAERRYSLDFRHPISQLQAFGIGLAGIARKLAVN